MLAPKRIYDYIRGIMTENITQKLQRAMRRLPLIEGPRTSSFLHPEYSDPYVSLSLTHSNLLRALHVARQARDEAVSYRNFNVGAAAVALKYRPSRLSFLSGINAKPDEDSELNMHAEQLAIQKAIDREDTAISMLVVVGDTQPDKQSGHEMHTLHPCGLCRDVMDASPLIDNEATLIVSAIPSFQTIEVYSLNALKKYHAKGDDRDESLLTRFDFPALELFEPVVHDKDQEVIYLEDTNEIRKDEAVWDNSVGLFLLQRRMQLLLQE